MIVVMYQDEGANGPGPQCMSVMAPRNSVHLFEDREELEQWLLKFQTSRRYRKSPKVVIADKTIIHERNRDPQEYEDGEDFYFFRLG